MTVYTKDQYDIMMKPMRDEIKKIDKKLKRKPVDLDKSMKLFSDNSF